MRRMRALQKVQRVMKKKLSYAALEKKCAAWRSSYAVAQRTYTLYERANAQLRHESARRVEEGGRVLKELSELRSQLEAPVPMLLWCPECGERHIDGGEFATKVHHTHSCQLCGLTWRPAIVATVGVRFLPGFKST